MLFCSRCGHYAADGVATCPACNAPFPTTAGSASSVETARAPRPEVEPPSTFVRFAGPRTIDQGPLLVPPGHVRRLVAFFLDGFLMTAIGAVGVLGVIFVGDLPGLALLLLATAGALAYEPGFIARHGATPGKRLMGMRVVNEDGGPVSLGQSVARWVIKCVFTGMVLPVCVPLVAPQRRALHDLFVSTVVVEA
jgi:uncharacterized RDD family membrane protein YckC